MTKRRSGGVFIPVSIILLIWFIVNGLTTDISRTIFIVMGVMMFVIGTMFGVSVKGVWDIKHGSCED